MDAQEHKQELTKAAQDLVNAIEAANMDGLEVGFIIGWALDRHKLRLAMFEREGGYSTPTITPKLRRPALEI